MTKVEAVVHEHRLADVLERLLLVGESDVAVYPVRSAGHGDRHHLAVRGGTVIVAFARKVMLEWYGPDERADTVVRAIRRCAGDDETGGCTVLLQTA
jgi:nitrogen regulatory protein PII